MRFIPLPGQLRVFLLTILTSGLIIHPAPAQSGDNPPRPGFNQAGSDPQAVAIADSVMQALGGRENWNNTRHITWNFFGRRQQVWDKWSGDYRLENGDMLVLMNLNTKNGKVWENGVEISDPDTLQARLDRAHSIWINDSYWLIMPYKLKDTGVTLTYRGEGSMENGRPAHILQLTFENVGDTPQNKYWVYVDKETYLVREWAYFPEAADEQPRFTTPWDNWKRYGNILLSGDRGRRQISDIAVFQELPARVYESPEKIDIMTYQTGAPE